MVLELLDKAGQVVKYALKFHYVSLSPFSTLIGNV
jgi:hypothetical protein